MEFEISSKKSKTEVAEVNKDIAFKAAELSKVINVRVSLLPAATTPDRNKDEAALDSDSPLSSSFNDEEVTDLDSSPRTPRSDVFDPFAPGRDDLLLAPLIKKPGKDSKIGVVRRLNFGGSIEAKDHSKEEVLLDMVCRSLLDAIVLKQMEEEKGVVAENCEGFTTPSKVPLLNGIAEICPDAPKKVRSNLKKIDLGLCRKLEF